MTSHSLRINIWFIYIQASFAHRHTMCSVYTECMRIWITWCLLPKFIECAARKTVALKNQLNWKEFIDCQKILNCSFFYCVIYGWLISNLIDWTVFCFQFDDLNFWCCIAIFELHISKLIQCLQFQEGYRNQFD